MEIPQQPADSLTDLQRAGIAIKTLRARLDAVEGARGEPVAVVGMGCRFPSDSADPQSFWRLLMEGRDAVCDVPDGRWDTEGYYDPVPGRRSKMYAKAGGFLSAIDNFDAHFFDIVGHEAQAMDPQHRRLLEASWEALENAGEFHDRNAGAPVGVFVGITAGVNILLCPKSTVMLCKAGLMSSTGRCRTFDAGADGMVRGEGCGVVVLKRLGDALAEGNHIHALIRGSAINQDGASSSLTAPNGRAQETVLHAALSDAGVRPLEVDYVEAHGSATSLGDPIEVHALGAVYGPEREQPPWVGSVKTNIGHLESAAGMAGLFKVILSLQHERLVPNLHFTTPNAQIEWERCRVQVCAEERAWPRTSRPRRAGVSGFGVSGTNAHVIVEEAPSAPPSGPSRSHHALVLSAPTASGLEALTQRLVEHLGAHPQQCFADVAYTLQTGRAPFAYRRMAVCSGREEAIAALSPVDPAQVVTRQVARGRERPVVFMFSGTGEHYTGMGAGLYQEEPLYREEFDRCAQLLHPELGCDLRELLYRAPGAWAGVEFADLVRGANTEDELTRTLLAHAAVFAVDYALGRLLMAWGLRPQLMLGYTSANTSPPASLASCPCPTPSKPSSAAQSSSSANRRASCSR